MENSPLGSSSSSSHGGGGSYFAVSSSSSSPGADCAEILGRSAASSNGISLYRGWNFDSESSITPKICITGSTSAGLHQILTWLYWSLVFRISFYLLKDRLQSQLSPLYLNLFGEEAAFGDFNDWEDEVYEGHKGILGSLPEGFDRYFASRFPKLLIEVYKILWVHCKDEEAFSKYFNGSSL